MTTAVQRRRGTNTEHASFTGLEGELSVNTTNESVHVHDGSTAGGFELARADASNIVATSIDINGGTIDGTAIGASSASTGAFTTLTASGAFTSLGIDDNADATAITIDSSENVGIGVTNPSDYYASWNNLVVGDTSGSAGMSIVTGTSNEGTIAFADGTSGDAQYKGYIQYNQGVDRLVIGVNGTEKMRIDSSGNVGIGTSSPTAPLDVRRSDASGIVAELHNNVGYGIDIGTSTAEAYISSGYQQDFLFKTNAGSGQAERMRIDSSGAVGIGTSSPATGYRLDISGSSGYDDVMRIVGVGTNIGPRINLTPTGTGNSRINATANSLLLQTGGTERMRIDSSGNVGIGATSVDTKLHLEESGATSLFLKTQNSAGALLVGNNSAGNSFVSAQTSGKPLILETENTERARIDSSGNLLVGTTSTSVTNTHGIQLFPASGGANKPRINIATAGYTSAEYPLSIWSTAVSAWRFYVQADGRISAVYTTINSLSDERVKENIRDLDDGLSKVMQLQPRKFDWKEGKGKNITNDRGFIAQEFEQVFPDLVSEWKDKAPEGEEPYKSVSADLIPTLVKAIQEQQTLIESLTARIAALEE